MCGPAALLATSLIVSAAGTAITYQGEQEQATSTAQYQKKAAQEGQALAKQQYDINIAQENKKQQQETEAQAQQTTQVRKEAAQARAQARVSASAAGVSGLNVDSLIADYDRQEANSIYSINRNREFGLQQSELNKQTIRTQGMAQLSSTRFKPIFGPSLSGTLTGAVSSGIGDYAAYNSGGYGKVN